MTASMPGPTPTASQAWASLAAAGLVQGAAPAAADDATPWYVTAMLGAAAWLAALFLLAFVAIALSDLLRNATGALAAGVLVCALAVAVMRRGGNGVFATQLAIAASLAGQALVGVGLLNTPGRGALEWAGVALFELVLVAAAPQPLHRCLATLAAALAVRLSLGAAGFAVLFPAVLAAAFVAVQGRSPRRLVADAVWGPVSIGIALALLLGVPLAMLGGAFAFDRNSVPWAGLPAWVGTATVAIALQVTVARLLFESGIGGTSRTGMAALGSSALVALATWPVPGVLVALIVLLEAFAAGRRTLAGIAVVALASELVHYYYLLQAPLLVKAASLAATGLVLLGARVVLGRMSATGRPERFIAKGAGARSTKGTP